MALFPSLNVVIPDELLPHTLIVGRIAKHQAEQFLSQSSRLSYEVRKNSLWFIMSVAKEAQLTERDSSLLASACNCSTDFAHKILKEVNNDNFEETLLTLRKPRFDSIQVTDWPSKIAEFVYKPENSRAVPGEETISIRYGVRKQKHILVRSRNDIAADFKRDHPDCKLGLSVIKREFPPNTVTATTRDNERNTCPTHANIRRIVKSINKVLRKNRQNPLPHSCRELCGMVMCNSPTTTIAEPRTWPDECVLNTCRSCPKFDVTIPDEPKPKVLNFSMWESRKVLVTKMNKEKTGELKEKCFLSISVH